MSGIAMLLPQPPTAVTAATLYVVTGIAVCALTAVPAPQRCAHPGDDQFGVAPGRVVLAVGAVVMTVALWPAALVRAIRTTLRTRTPNTHALWTLRQRAQHRAETSAMLREDECADQPVYLAHRIGSRNDGPAGAQWVDAAAAKVVAALHERRLLDAAWSARQLMWDIETTFGPESHQLWQATELLAHVCHEIGDDTRAVQLYARAATGWARNSGAGHPDARAARERMAALWAKTRTQPVADQATALLVASVNRTFAQVSQD